MREQRPTSEEYVHTLTTLVQSAPVGMGFIDRELRYVRVNDALAAAHGLGPDAHVGRLVAEVVPELWASVEPLLRRVLDGETIVNFDIAEHGAGASGAPRRWLASYYPVRIGEEVVGIGSVVNDVSDLRAAEDALRARTDMYSMLSRTNRAVSLCESRDELFRQVCEIAVNAGRFRFAWVGVPYSGGVRLAASAGIDGGYMAELARSDLMISLDPEDARARGPTGQALLSGVRAVVNDSQVDPSTAPWHDAARRAGMQSSAAFPIRERGHVAAVLTLYASTPGFFTPELVDALGEITPALSFALDRFALEEDRAAGEADLQLRDRALRAATQGVVITDARAFDNPVIYVSPSFERLTGYTSAEIVGRNCRVLQGPDTDDAALAEIRRAVAERRACIVELLNYRRDGHPFYNSLAISPIVDGSGEVTHYVGVQTDVTERRELERQLRQAQKMEAVGQLAGGVAHDFNNVLTVIHGAVGLALAEALGDDLRETLEQIDAAADHAASLTKQLLAFSRRQVLKPEPSELNSVVVETERLVLQLLRDDVRLVTQLGRDLPSVLVDREQLRQVILNLAINARDAMPGGGQLTVRTDQCELDESYAATHLDAEPGRYLMLELTDTGIGMDEETVNKVFDPFFTTKATGTGLGLATVYGIVKQSGGHISLYSEPGYGTTFRIYLPATLESAAATLLAPAQAPAREPALDGHETVLYVEDSDLLRPVVARMLSPYGYTVLTAANADEALELDARHPGGIDLLLSDSVMPGVGGRELAQTLRDRHPALKVLLTSGYPAEMIVGRAPAAQVEFIRKPFLAGDLASKIRSVLDAGDQLA
jgi:PAS domain S-box-containing protein